MDSAASWHPQRKGLTVGMFLTFNKQKCTVDLMFAWIFKTYLVASGGLQKQHKA